jgi:TetR/AcrR family transcriptional repressor of nem operon
MTHSGEKKGGLLKIESTKTRALKEAKDLFQRVGYDGFSFQDIADKIGIKKGSLYEHFKSKEELMLYLVDFSSDVWNQWTETISVFEPKDQVNAYFERLIKYSDEEMLCPVSSMGKDAGKLSRTVRTKIANFCESHNAWLARTLKAGQKRGQFRKDVSYIELADLVFSVSLGAQLMARAVDDSGEINKMRNQLFKLIAADAEVSVSS